MRSQHVALALLMALVALCFWGLQDPAPKAPTLPARLDAGARPAPRPPESSSPRFESGHRVEVSSRSSFRFQALWTDGTSAAGCRFWLDDESRAASADAHGVVHIDAAKQFTVGEVLPVNALARGWLQPREVQVTIETVDSTMAQGGNVVLPAEVDAHLELQISPEVQAVLATSEPTSACFEVRGGSATRSVVDLELLVDERFESWTEVDVLISLPWRDRYFGQWKLRSDSKVVLQMEAELRVRATQPLHWRSVIDVEHIIAGQVVDSRGGALDNSRVFMVEQRPDLAAGLRRSIVDVDRSGRFVAVPRAGSVTLRAVADDARGKLDDVSAGTLDARIVASTEGESELVVWEGGRPVERCLVSRRSKVFGQRHLPELPVRPGGVCLVGNIPAGDQVYVAWLAAPDQRLCEDVYTMPPLGADGRAHIHVDSASAPRLGSVRIDYGEHQCLLRIESVDRPMTGTRTGLSVLTGTNQDWDLHGLPFGRYRVSANVGPLGNTRELAGLWDLSEDHAVLKLRDVFGQ